MSVIKKLRVFLLCFVILLLATPSFAADRDMTANDLQGIPKHHHYILSVLGGAALGAGVGALLPGGGNSILKGALIGGGGLSEIYLHRHRYAAGGWSDWAHIADGTALGTGIGWTLCDCGDGAIGGALIGGGGTAAWRAWNQSKTTTTASTNPAP